MKNKFNYFKKLLKVLIWPIIFMIGSFLIRYVFVAIFNKSEKVTMNNKEFLSYIKTIEYQEKLNSFIDSKTILILLITLFIFLPLLYFNYKKYIKPSNFKIKDIFIPILFGVSISIIYNIVFYNLNNIIHFTNNFDGSNLPIIVLFISSGIIGPILEELLFRGIVYNKLKEFNKPMKSIVLTSIIFGVIHFNLLNTVYAFGVSFILIYLYEKYKTIKAPILMHVCLNTTSVWLLYLLKLNYTLFNVYLVIVSIGILLLLKFKIIKE